MEKVKIGYSSVLREEFTKWTNALRSGEFKQTKNRLQDENGYCCLGVACKLFIPKNKLELENGFIYGKMPHEQESPPVWLNDVSDDFFNKSGVFLSLLNDRGIFYTSIVNEPFTFEEIADLLEAVYLYNVLDAQV